MITREDTQDSKPRYLGQLEWLKWYTTSANQLPWNYGRKSLVRAGTRVGHGGHQGGAGPWRMGVETAEAGPLGQKGAA